MAWFFARTSKKTTIILVAVLVVVIGLVVGGLHTKQRHDAAAAAAAQKVAAEKRVYNKPPTEQEVQSSDQHKDEAVDRMKLEQQAADNPPTTKKSVTPVITNASQNDGSVTVTAYISGIFEDGGTCALEAAQADKRLVRTVAAHQNATTTDCSPFLLKTADFAATGDWSITVRYTSPAAEGSSASQTLKVQ